MSRRVKRGAGVGVWFPPGAPVEVRSNDDGFRGAWYEATVVRRMVKRRCYDVAYISLIADDDPSEPLREIVKRSNVRPIPPRPTPADARYGLHQQVEAFHNDGWWAGVICGVQLYQPAGRYKVCFPTSREEIEFESSEIRPQLLWIRGEWIPVDKQKGENPTFKVGGIVEVSRLREKYGDSWFDAKILKVFSSSTFLVEYDDMKVDGSDGMLTEIVDVLNIRPLQPLEPELKVFGVKDEVEVLLHGGWTAGRVLQILDNSKCTVELNHAQEEMEVGISQLRSRCGWNGSVWVPNKMIRKSSAVVKGRRPSKLAGKIYSLPISVPTDSGDSEGTCESSPNFSSSKRRMLEGSSPGEQVDSLQTSSIFKKVKLLKCILRSHNNILDGDSTALPRTGVENGLKMTIAKDSLSSLGEDKHCMIHQRNSALPNVTIDEGSTASPCIGVENGLKMSIAKDKLSSKDEHQHTKNPCSQRSTALPNVALGLSPSPSSIKPAHQKVSTMSGLPEFRGEGPLGINFEDSAHQSKASQEVALPFNPEESDLPLVAEWRNSKGVCCSRFSFAHQKKKLVVRRPRKRAPEVTAQNQMQTSDKPSEKHIGGICSSTQREFENSKISANVFIEKRDPNDMDGHPSGMDELVDEGPSADIALTLPQQNEVPGPQGSPLRLHVAELQDSDNMSICRVVKQIDYDQDCCFTPLTQSITTNASPIKSFTDEPLSNVILSLSNTRFQDAPASCDYNTRICSENQIVQLSLKKNNAVQKEFIQTKSLMKMIENGEALVDPMPPRSPPEKDELPFIKNSYMWDSIESMEVFQIMPQSPHFRLLEQYSMEFREGMAIGLMVSFANLVSSIKKLQVGDAHTTIEEKLRALGPLEANGFNVHFIRFYLQELLKLQIHQRQLENEKTLLGGKILMKEKDNDELDTLIMVLDKNIFEIEQNLRQLHEKRDSLSKQKKSNESEISKMQMNMLEAEEAYHLAEENFNVSIAAPWRR